MAKASATTKSAKSLTNQPTFITGFPGFLTRHLMRRLFERNPKGTFYFLVERRHHQLAEERLEELLAKHPNFKGETELIDGDITEPHLGLDEETYNRLASKVKVVWHLAAIYDLAISEDTAYRINVLGTFHMLDFCEACKSLERFNYISTCYVSGKRKGAVLETELDCNQDHQNHYESTKFWAEVEVQRRSDLIPTVIFRPAIVVGDSTTGETDKYDGPYYFFKLVQRLPTWMPLPKVLENGAVINLVPVDFVADALAEIAHQPDAHGAYQLADHRPLTVPQILKETGHVFGRKMLPELIPTKLLDVVKGVGPVESLLQMPGEVIDYFSQQAKYDTLRTRTALDGTGIECPPLVSYMETLIRYMEDHPDKGFLDNRRR